MAADQSNWLERSKADGSFIDNLYVVQNGSANGAGNFTLTPTQANWLNITSGVNDIITIIQTNAPDQQPHNNITIAPDPGVTVTVQNSGNILLANGATSVTLDGTLREFIVVRWDIPSNTYVQVSGKGTGSSGGSPIDSINGHTIIADAFSQKIVAFSDAIQETYANLAAIKNGTAMYLAYQNQVNANSGFTGTLTSSSGGSATVLSDNANGLVLIGSITGTFLNGDTITDTSNTATILFAYQPGIFQEGYYLITDPDQSHPPLYPNTNFRAVVLRSEFGNTFAKEALGLFSNPDYQHVGDYSGVIAQTGNATFLGNWSATSPGAVQIGDIVFNDGVDNKYYVNQSGVNTGTDPLNDGANWQFVSFTNGYNGGWSPSNGFIINQVTTYNGKHYANLTGNNTSTTPALDATNWLVLPYTASGTGYILEWDEIKYDFDNDFLVAREDARANKVFGPSINTFQWGNNRCLGNTIETTGTFNNINQSADFVGVRCMDGSSMDAEFSSNTLGGINMYGVSTMDVHTNTGAIQSIQMYDQASLVATSNAGIIDDVILKGSASADFSTMTGTGAVLETTFYDSASVSGTNFAGIMINCEISGIFDITNASSGIENVRMDSSSAALFTNATADIFDVRMFASFLNMPGHNTGQLGEIDLFHTEFTSLLNSGTIRNLSARDSSITDVGAVGYSGTMETNRFNNCLVTFDDAGGNFLDNDFNHMTIDFSRATTTIADNTGDFGQVYLADAAGYLQQSYLGAGTTFTANVAYVGNTSQLILDSGGSVDASSMDGVLSQTIVETAGILDVSTMTPNGRLSLVRVSSFGLLDASVLDGFIEGTIVEQNSTVDASTMTITGTMQDCSFSEQSFFTALLNSGDIWENVFTSTSNGSANNNSGVIEANFIKTAGSFDCTNNAGDVISCEVSNGNFDLTGNAGNVYGVVVTNTHIIAPRGTGFSLEDCRFEDAASTFVIPPYESFSNEKMVRGQSTFSDIFPIWNQLIPAIILTEKEYAGVIKLLQSDEMLITGVTGTFLTGETVSAPGGFSAKIAINPAFTPGSLILVNVAGIATLATTITGDFSGATAVIGVSTTTSTQTYPLLTGMDGNHPVRFYADPDIPSVPTIQGTTIGAAGLNQIVLVGPDLLLKNSAAKPDFIVLELDKVTSVNGEVIRADYI